MPPVPQRRRRGSVLVSQRPVGEQLYAYDRHGGRLGVGLGEQEEGPEEVDDAAQCVRKDVEGRHGGCSLKF